MPTLWSWILVAGLQAGQAGGAQTCAKCHEKEHRAELGTAHAASCVDCHGGDPRAPEKERSHAGLTGKIARAAVPALCARCHSDPRRMNPTGLPTDQHSQYLTSKHGEALARGILHAALCIDCHGAHGIRPSRDPLASVHPSRVPATCGRCHSDPSLMAKTGHPADAESLYRKSVHGERLLGKGDPAAPTCATCHGNHGAVPPGFAEVGRVCGKCHVPERELFEKSPHAFYTGDKGFKDCVTCHGNHAIVRDSAGIAGRCAPCHEPGDKEFVKWNALQGRVGSARERFRRTEERVGRMARAGYHTDDEQLALEEARTSLVQLAPLQHTLSLEKVGASAGALDAALGKIDARLDAQERTEGLKKLALVPVWAFLLALAGVFWAKKREVERGRA